MILREILKTICQIEVRTEQLLSGSFCVPSTEPSAELGGVSFAMPDCADDDLRRLLFDDEIEGVGPAQHFHFPRHTTNKPKPFRIFGRLVERIRDRQSR